VRQRSPPLAQHSSAADEQRGKQGTHSIDAILSFIVLFAAVPTLYGLHRLGLYLENRGLIYYWHKKPTGGSAYNPLLELVQPQIRHVIEVSQQRLGNEADREGASPLRATSGASLDPDLSSGRADAAGCRAHGPPGAGG